ncbi:MAG: hypothetical protein QME42_02595 [bacterium]|nr:hypothetical protein [bacterium]
MSEWQQIADGIAKGFFIALVFFTVFGGIMAFIVYKQQRIEEKKKIG